MGSSLFVVRKRPVRASPRASLRGWRPCGLASPMEYLFLDATLRPALDVSQLDDPTQGGCDESPPVVAKQRLWRRSGHLSATFRVGGSNVRSRHVSARRSKLEVADQRQSQRDRCSHRGVSKADIVPTRSRRGRRRGIVNGRRSIRRSKWMADDRLRSIHVGSRT